MSQRSNDDRNRYKDFPKSFDEFQRLRQSQKNTAPVSPKSQPQQNQIPISPTSYARQNYQETQSPRNQEMSIPIVSNSRSNSRQQIPDSNQRPNSRAKNVTYKESTTPKVVRGSSMQSPSRPKSPEESPINPTRTKPPFNSKVAVDSEMYSDNKPNSRPNFIHEDSLNHSEWLTKKDQEKKQNLHNQDPNQSRRNKELEFGWKNIDVHGVAPPHEFTISHINQHHDLLRLDDLKVAPEMNLGSTEWLNNYSIDFLGLTLKDLLAKGVVSKPVSDKTGKAVQHITFDSVHVDEFEYKLNLALEMYSKRIKWLMQSSKKLFGLVQGERTAVLIDTSEANIGFGRAVDLQDALLSLISEQMSKKRQFYFATYGTDVNELWEDSLIDVHHRSVEEAKQFVTHLYHSGGSNLLKALKKVSAIRDIDSIVLVIGSVPDQSMDIIVDYMNQIILNKECPFHCVSFDFNNHIVNSALKSLAEESNGRYHSYSNSHEEMIYNSTDVSILLKEIQKTQELLNRIKDMKEGTLGSAIVQIANQISLELEACANSNYLPRPRGHDLPLNIEKQSTNERSSVEWVNQHGLKRNHLNLYQVLKSNAYDCKEYYIPILNKTVTSQVHSQAMVQFPWHDGTIKNLHVDMAELYDYQKKLRSVVELFEKRIDWLSSGSRKIFGSIAEDSVVILIDLSQVNANYLIHIQHSLRLLLEQQMPNKKCFNLIAFGRQIKRWKPTVVKPTPILLQDAWKWILNLKCQGTHNVLGAIRAALENEEERKHNINVDGLYLFTSGMPDQPVETICSYLEESAVGQNLNIHTILFNVDDYDGNGPIVGRWANITNTADALRTLAHSTIGGRFHWFRETGIIESDDIIRIQKEIEATVDFSNMATHLVDTVKRKTCTNKITDCEFEEEFEKCDVHNKQPSKPVGPPRQNKASLQRIKLKEKEKESEQAITHWRPNSSKTEFISSGYKQSRPSSSKSSASLATTEAFYVGGSGNSKGAVFRHFPEKKSVRKSIPVVKIPEKEEPISTKDWLKKYSLIKLKMDLNKLTAGSECKHSPTTANDSHQRYCTIFEHINVNGVIRHLQLNCGELNDFTRQCEIVLKRYVKRLQWLLSGTRRLFGTFTEQRCSVLIDTSGSMDPFMSELRKELASLVWEQFYKNKISFNLIRFSDRVEKFSDEIVEPTEDNCHRAIAWLATLTAHGSTCTLDALYEAFDDQYIESIYLLSDGKPDHSTTLVLDEVKNMNAHRGLKINSISFNCEDKSANMFLGQLSAENNGRYHRSSNNDREILLFAHKILTQGIEDSFLSHIPEFESDDLRRISSEIFKAKQFLRQSIDFAKLYDKNARDGYFRNNEC